MHRFVTIFLLLGLAFALPPAGSTEAQPENGTFTEILTRLEFVKIPGGSFMMGDTAHRGYDFEGPIHKVTLKEFYIGRHEVTFDAYDMFAEEAKRPLPDDAGWGRGNRPVINVSWYDAREFAKWLSKKSGKRFRLPSEAEWEYAAKAGTDSPYWWGSKIGTGNANCNGCGSRWDSTMTAPVGSFPPNAYGLYDVLGNVYEWVEDAGHDSYKGAPVDGSAWSDETSQTRIMRSSSYRDEPRDVRTSIRNWAGPERSLQDTGFRLVMEP